MRVSIAKRSALTLLLSLFVLLLGVACGGEQGANGGGNEGADSPGVEGVVVDEFSNLDANNNNELTQEEFDEGLFGSFDTDNSGTIAGEEFNATDDFFGDFNVNFNDFDANNNNELTQQEFSEGLADAGLFGEWDADNDNVIDENEFDEVFAEGGGTTMQGGTTMMQGGTTMQGGVITDIQQLVNAQNPQSLIGRQVQLQTAKVQEVPGDVSFLIGPNANQTVFAVLGDELVGAQAEQAVDVNAGQTLALTGVVRQTPSVQQAQQNLGLTRAEARQLQNQPFFLFVQEVQAIR